MLATRVCRRNSRLIRSRPLVVRSRTRGEGRISRQHEEHLDWLEKRLAKFGVSEIKDRLPDETRRLEHALMQMYPLQTSRLTL